MLDTLQKRGLGGCGVFCTVIPFVGGWQTYDWAVGLEIAKMSTEEAVLHYTLLKTAPAMGANEYSELLD